MENIIERASRVYSLSMEIDKILKLCLIHEAIELIQGTKIGMYQFDFCF